MNILAFDTCFDACSVAAATGNEQAGRRLAHRFEPMRMGQAERLLPMLGETLAEIELPIGALNRIACTHGPGTFTGTRITIAAARALALATGATIVSVSSLELMAHSPRIADLTPQDRIVIATDAHRGEVYAQAFAGPRREAVTQPMRLTLADACGLCQNLAITHVAGSASMLIAGIAQNLIVLAPDLLPCARDLIALAAIRTPLAEPPNPLYLRPPDAKQQSGKSIARAT